MTLELYPYGDTELFYALGEAGNWSLPVLVHWRHDKAKDKHYGLVVPAVGLYYSQGLTLQGLLQVHDIQGKNDCWLVPRNMIEAILHKAPGITPLAYYKWPGEDMPPIPLPKVLQVSTDGCTVSMADSVPSANGSFISYISQKSSISTSIIRAVITSITQHGAAWMLEKRQPLELGFCKLIATPFRSNWKEIVSYKCKKWKLLGMFNLEQKERMMALEEAGMPEVMCSLHNIALQKATHRIEYTIEAIPTNKFEKEVDRVETRRMASGRVSYVEHFETTVKKLYVHLLESLKSYVKKTNAPFAGVRERGDTGQPCFVPTLRQFTKVYGVGLGNLPVNIVSPGSNFSIFGESSEPLVVQKQIAGVSEVSIVPQENENVRRCNEQGDVGQQGKEGTDRLLVLDAVQEPTDRC